VDNWIQEEMVGVSIGDKRLDSRLVKILQDISGSPNMSIPASCTGWSDTKAVYRFMDNDSIDPQDILAPHFRNTIERMAFSQEETILCAQDTSFCAYHSQEGAVGLGPHSNDRERGLFLHPLLALSTTGIPFGLLSSETWVRPYEEERNAIEKELAEKRKNKETFCEEKESQRWLRALDKTDECASQLPSQRVINVADRECDFFEFLAAERKYCDFLVRSSHNRTLDTGEKLHDMLRALPVNKRVSIDIPKHGNRPARKINAQLRYKLVTIDPPSTLAKSYAPVQLTAVHLVEEGWNENSGIEKIEWFLLSSVSCATPGNAFELMQWYAQRWGIEVFFRTLKTGCGIEKMQLKTRARLDIALALYMIVAWRVQYLVLAGKELGGLSAAAFFDKEEWRAAYVMKNKKLPPKRPPTLKETLWFIAGLGGFLGRKRDGHPGAKSIWIGLQRIHDMGRGINVGIELASCG